VTLVQPVAVTSPTSAPSPAVAVPLAAAGGATPAPAPRSKVIAMESRSPSAAWWCARGAAGLVALGLAACTASSEEVRPPADQIFYPTGIALSPDQSTLFVASANSDLRYDSGTIAAFGVADVARVVRAWQADRTVPTDCSPDQSATETLECDEAIFLRDGAGAPREGAVVRVGNFASALAVQDKGGGNARLMVPVRGDPSITWIDWDATTRTLGCGGGGGLPLCDDAHRLTRIGNDEDLPALVEEPYGVHADSAGEYALVTHLTSGTVTLVDSPKDGPPSIVDSMSGLFASNANGARGASGVAARAPGGLVYVTSRSDPRVQLLAVAKPAVGTPFLVASSYFFLDDAVGTRGGDSGDSRGVAFGAGGDRAYLVVRNPPSLQAYDTSLDASGAPRNRLIGATDLCRQASSVLVADTGGDTGERVYVACFQSGELYVIDGRHGVEIDNVTTVGRAPYGLAAAPAEHLLFVSNFLEDSVAVVDVDPASATYHHVLLRIGVRP